MTDRDLGPKTEHKQPSLLADIKTVTLQLAKFQKEPSHSAYGGMIGMGLMGAGFGPGGALIGMAIGAITGEVIHIRTERMLQKN